MSKKRKKHYQPGMQKVQQAQHRNDYFKRLGIFLKALTGEDVLTLIPPEERDRLYAIRTDVITAEAQEGHDVPHDLINSIKGIVNSIFKSHPIPVENTNQNVYMTQYYAFGVSLCSFCGLINIPHMKNIYGLYHNPDCGYRGIIKNEDSNDVNLSSIPVEEQQVGILYFNKDGYSTYCKEYREYWDWVEKRNETRYQNTQSHGKNYDAKNMMHVFRLLEMAIEIGRDKAVNVKRENRDFLLNIKSGKYEYEELLKMADDKQKEMEDAFSSTSLPDMPDIKKIKK